MAQNPPTKTENLTNVKLELNLNYNKSNTYIHQHVCCFQQYRNLTSAEYNLNIRHKLKEAST